MRSLLSVSLIVLIFGILAASAQQRAPAEDRSSAPSEAHDIAPLPLRFNGDAAPGELTRGLYLHATHMGTYQRFGSPEEFEAHREQVSRCLYEMGRELRISGDPAALRSAEYWLYRAGGRTILYERTHVGVIDQRTCMEEFVEQRRIERAPFRQAGTRDPGSGWPPIFQRTAVDCRNPRLNCVEVQIAGLAASCFSAGDGFIGRTECSSLSVNASRGLVLRHSFSDDTLSGSVLEVDELEEDIPIPEIVFSPGGNW